MKDYRNTTTKVQKKKLTKEEIKERARIRKQQSRQRIKEKYGDEEYKKKRALEAKERRQKKKNIVMID